MTVGETFSSEQVRRYIIGGGSMGAAVSIIQLLATNPKFPEVVLSWGPLFLISIAVIGIADRRMAQMLEAFKDSTAVQREAAAQSQKLADAVQVISKRDDERSRELELVTGHLARTNEQIFKVVKDIQAQMESDRATGRSYGHSAS